MPLYRLITSRHDINTLLLILSFLVWLGDCPSLLAMNGGLIELPFSPPGKVVYSKQAGMRLQIDTRWVGEHGYRPVKYTFSLPRPTQADIQLTLRFFAGRGAVENSVIIVEQDFELPAGRTSASFSLSVPEYQEWRFVGAETWVDGVKDQELSLEFAQHPQSNIARGGYNFAAMLLNRDSSMPVTQLLSDVRGAPADVYPWNNDLIPEKWIDYSSFDVVITNIAELKAIQKRSPQRLVELLHWIRSGGNLWFMDAGRSYQRIPQIESLLDIPSDEDAATITAEELLKRGWRFPKVDNPGTDAVEKLSQLLGPVPEARDEPTENSQAEYPSDSREWFASRLFGMGTVTAFMGNRTRREDIDETSWAITQSLLADRLSWVGRHGNDPDEGNDNFNDWLIPDVGTAPVTPFQVLLSLFVLGIGPVNYFLLNRREQLPLLLITVPAAAFATILMLLVYSFMSDGFGARVRVRSFTFLDQRSQTAACWARLSYFAGIAPAEGLTMPADTLVYPILPPSRTGNRRMIRKYAQQKRELHWNGAEKLVEGWLSSRTPTQYLTIASRLSPRQIAFESVVEGLQATNRLGVDIRTLLVVDAEGKIYLAENLPADESRLLPQSTQVQAMMQLRSQFSENEPQFPPGTMESLTVEGNIRSFPFSQNLMETQLSAISSAVFQGWSPRTFIAVTDHGMDLSLGLEEISESASFHVVRGQW